MALNRLACVVAILAFVVEGPSTMQGAVEDLSWQSLRKIPHDAVFVFIDRNLGCKSGQVHSSSEKNLTVRVNGSDVILEKSDLLRVQRWKPSTDSYAPLSVVYSGRSSWADIKDFMPFLSAAPSYEIRLAIVTTQGKNLKGMLKEATDSGLVLRDPFLKEIRISRDEIATVDYIRLKPLSDKQEFYQQELGLGVVFDAVLYPRIFHVADTMPVRLYDRAVTQDDSPLQCK